MRFMRVGLVLAMCFALGCEEAATGPTTAEFNQKRAELKQRAKQKKGAPKPGKPAVAKARGAGGTAGLGAVDFVYDPIGKRDPFRDFKWDRAEALADLAATSPLVQFDLSQIELVAVVWKTGNARALVQDPSGTSYIIAEGARIGRNDGYVTSIDDNLLRVREKYVDSMGRETMKDIELSMRRNEGG